MKRLALLTFAPALLAIPTLGYAAEDPLFSTNYITIDAAIVHDVTPDDLNLYAYCDQQQPASRREVRANLQSIFEQVEAATLSNLDPAEGSVRRNGPISIYPNYGPDPSASAQFSGSMNVAIRYVKPENAIRLSEAIEDLGCNITWDARLKHTAKFAQHMKTDLMELLAEKRAAYEDWLGFRLDRISGINLSTSADPYAYGGGYGGGGYGPVATGNYDPRTNKMTVTTSASITYEYRKAW